MHIRINEDQGSKHTRFSTAVVRRSLPLSILNREKKSGEYRKKKKRFFFLLLHVFFSF